MKAEEVAGRAVIETAKYAQKGFEKVATSEPAKKFWKDLFIGFLRK